MPWFLLLLGARGEESQNDNDVIHPPSEDEWTGMWELDRSLVDNIIKEMIGDDDDVDGEITSHFIFANNESESNR